MEKACERYKLQRSRALIVLDQLKKQRDEIEFQLKSNESNPYLHKDLRAVNLDIKITMNEIEHAEDRIQECESTNSISS